RLCQIRCRFQVPRLLLALCRCRLGLCSNHCLPPSASPMTTYQFLTRAWTWNSIVLSLVIVSCLGYGFAFGRRGRPLYFVGAIVLFLLALVSPLGALASGYVFSAHMVQHILLVLIVPALLLLSLPRSFSLSSSLTHPTYRFAGWAAGVGAMWL